jgi:hypothetical protein
MYRDQTLLKSSSLLQFVKTESPKVKPYFLEKSTLLNVSQKKFQGGLSQPQPTPGAATSGDFPTQRIHRGMKNTLPFDKQVV